MASPEVVDIPDEPRHKVKRARKKPKAKNTGKAKADTVGELPRADLEPPPLVDASPGDEKAAKKDLFGQRRPILDTCLRTSRSIPTARIVCMAGCATNSIAGYVLRTRPRL